MKEQPRTIYERVRAGVKATLAGRVSVASQIAPTFNIMGQRPHGTYIGTDQQAFEADRQAMMDDRNADAVRGRYSQDTIWHS